MFGCEAENLRINQCPGLTRLDRANRNGNEWVWKINFSQDSRSRMILYIRKMLCLV